MCTAVSFKTKGHYFGRNLDYERSFGEEVVIVPRAYPLRFRCMGHPDAHYAIIGMAHISDGYPLFYDGVNEKGLAMAGLLFPKSAVYHPVRDGYDNISPFELIPWVLGRCADAAEAGELLSRASIAAVPFSRELPLSPLHWMIADRELSLTVEPMEDGLRIIKNDVRVLTNEPPFSAQLWNLSQYMGLSCREREGVLSSAQGLSPVSKGTGAVGLPGDPSSPSRFVRAAFALHSSVCGSSEAESVAQLFHILGSAAQPRGCVRLEGEQYEITRYSCCCSTDAGIYYYTTYENSALTAVHMHAADLSGRELLAYPLITEQQVLRQN